MKTTIYELLGLIKDGKAPKRIKYDRYTYWFCETAYHRENGGIISGEYLGEDFRLDLCLNDKVEILDEPKEDKIEKIDMFDYFRGYWYKELPEDFKKHLENNFETLNEIINKIIDRLNKENK